MVPKVSRCRNIHRSSLDQSKFPLFSHSDPKMFFFVFSHTTVRLLSGPLNSNLIASAQLCVSVCSNEELWECQRGHLIEAKGGGFWGRASARGSKGPSSHLGPDKRTWQISKWSPMYYISVRTPSAFPPTLHFHLWHGHIDLKERRGVGREWGVSGGREGCWVSVGVIMCPIQSSRWDD